MISIIIPTYNRAGFLPRTIKSVLNQTYQDWELIVSDDGSTDNTEAIVKDFLKDPRIKYVKNKNAGATAARNSGAKLASGTHVTFLDSDDEAKSNWLEVFQKEIVKGEEVICCGYDYIDHDGKLVRTNYPINMGALYNNRIGRFTNGGVFVIKKEYFEEINGYDENVKSGQHSELAIRLFEVLDRKKVKIKNLYEPLIKVHVHKDAKIRNDDKAIYEGVVYTLNKHQDLFKSHKDLLINYLKVGAVSAFRVGREKEAKKLFFKAWINQPHNFKTLSQYLLSCLPFLGRKVWNRK